MEGGRTSVGVSPRKAEKFFIRKGSVTVRVYPTPPGWTVAWVSPDGRKRKYWGTETDARKHASEVADQLHRGVVKVISTEEMATLQRSREILAPFGVSIELATAEWADARKMLGDVTLPEAVKFYLSRRAVASLPVPEAVEIFKKYKQSADIGDRHTSDLESRLAKFSEAFKEITADRLTPTDLDAWLCGLKKEDGTALAPQTRNHYRSAVINFLTFASAPGRRWLSYRMEEFAEHVKALDVRHERVAIYTPEEGIALFKACWEKLLPSLVLAAFCGLRSSEIKRVDWRGVDFDAGAVYDFDGKVRTAGDRIAYLPPNAIEWLRPFKRAAGKVCPYEALEGRWGALAEKAGIGALHNGLRHSFVSYRLAIVGDLGKVSEEVGTDRETLRKKYRRPVLQQVAQKWFDITPEGVRTASDGWVKPSWWEAIYLAQLQQVGPVAQMDRAAVS